MARKIRKQPWGETMLLVASTGWGLEAGQRKSSKAGCNAHMVKPVDFNALMTLLGDGPARQNMASAQWL